jgi:hypothetical protein
MKMQMNERLIMDQGAMMRRTTDGYLVAAPRVARTGIQLYRGSEVGMKDRAVVRVYRPEQAVFDKDSMATMAFKPITDDHPPVQVTAENWKEYAVGQSGDQVARDGEFIRVPMVLMDQKSITKLEAGKAELSVGYNCNIDFVDGKTDDGLEYDAVQSDIRVNHIAIVTAARGGHDLRIGDNGTVSIDMKALGAAIAAIGKGEVNLKDGLDNGTALIAGDKKHPVIDKDGTVYELAVTAAKASAVIADNADMVSACDLLLQLIKDGKPEETQAMNDKTRTIVVDGLSVQTDDMGSQIVERHIKALNDGNAKLAADLKALQDKFAADTTALQTTIATLTTDKAGLEAKVTTMESQIKDSEMTPAKLDALVADRAVVAGKAKTILGDKLVIDGKTDLEIKRQVVDAKLGDKAKGWTDVQVIASFDTLTADVKVAASAVADTARAFSGQSQHSAQDSESRYEARDKKLEAAWKTPNPVAAH